MNEFAKKFKKDVVFIAIATQSKESVEKGIKDIQKIKKKTQEKYTPIEFYQATDLSMSYLTHIKEKEFQW